MAAHQVQVGGLWVPGLLVPDPTRLWAFGRGPGLAGRGTRGVWGLVKALLVVAVAAVSLSASAPAGSGSAASSPTPWRRPPPLPCGSSP